MVDNDIISPNDSEVKKTRKPGAGRPKKDATITIPRFPREIMKAFEKEIPCSGSREDKLSAFLYFHGIGKREYLSGQAAMIADWLEHRRRDEKLKSMEPLNNTESIVKELKTFETALQTMHDRIGEITDTIKDM